ncbi:MAG: cobalamin-binding protein [Alphaproteobacteria bacterium]|nr:MAG: cobalamin-binding protein [Alphaproteobacteria bacterium]
MFPPARIVCLTEETVETLYLLGEERRIVGVSGYAVRPPQVRKEKPRVSAFISADFEKILALKPDLVLTFSDLQADIAAELIRRNIAVHAFNQRDVAGILDMIRTLGALVGAAEKAEALAVSLDDRLDAVRERAAALPRRPRIYFEEWDEPMISGIKWVSELIGIAGGIEAFPALAENKNAKDRIVGSEQVISAAPDIIIGSWCGKKFVRAKLAARPGFGAIPAVRDGALFEIKSALILQPGPAALTDGLDQLVRIVAGWACGGRR